MPKNYVWMDSHGYIELSMTLKQAKMVPLSGQCDEGVEQLLAEPDIARQLDAIDPKTIAKVLGEYGAWEDEELDDDEQNRLRLLWMSASDVHENPKDYA